MLALVVAFILQSINPIGGLTFSIPFAVWTLHWPGWLAVVLGVPLAYVQVLVVDFFWNKLLLWPWFTRQVEKQRPKRLELLLAHRHSVWLLALFGPWMGPWLVMAVARFAGRRQAQVGPSLFCGLTYAAICIAAIAVYAPKLLAK